MSKRYIFSKDRSRCIRAEMTDDLHTVVWFGHLPYGNMPENDVPVVDMDEAEALTWANEERKKPAPVAPMGHNPFA